MTLSSNYCSHYYNTQSYRITAQGNYLSGAQHSGQSFFDNSDIFPPSPLPPCPRPTTALIYSFNILITVPIITLHKNLPAGTDPPPSPPFSMLGVRRKT